MSNNKNSEQSALVIYYILIAIFGFTMAFQGVNSRGFWWTDETRHAMGGVFILDFFRDMPVSDPFGYALQYFAQYPALALNWYLPGFYSIEAIFFAIFGISELTAHWVVLSFSLLAGILLYEWTRRTWGNLSAFLSAILLLSIPRWTFWTSSIMLDIPTISMMIATVLFFELYLNKPSHLRALLTGLVMAGAILFKQTIIFLLPALLIYGLWDKRRSALISITSLWAYCVVVGALALTALHAIKFGGQGMSATVGDGLAHAGLAGARFSLERWLLYPNTLLQALGYPLVIFSLIGAFWPSKGNEPQLLLLRLWFCCWYISASILFGSPALENAGRYILYIAPAIAILAVRPIFLLKDSRPSQLIMVTALVFIVLWNIRTTLQQSVPHVDGFPEVAKYIHETKTKAPILYAGKYDGSFIFHMRAQNNERDDIILRADKTLISIAVNKSFGVKSNVSSVDEIRKMIKNLKVEYIILERPDLIEIKEFDMLYKLVQQLDFEKKITLPINSIGTRAPNSVEIYKVKNYASSKDLEFIIPFPQMGRDIRITRKVFNSPE